jgi:hypothetical protein
LFNALRQLVGFNTAPWHAGHRFGQPIAGIASVSLLGCMAPVRFPTQHDEYLVLRPLEIQHEFECGLERPISSEQPPRTKDGSTARASRDVSRPIAEWASNDSGSPTAEENWTASAVLATRLLLSRPEALRRVGGSDMLNFARYCREAGIPPICVQPDDLRRYFDSLAADPAVTRTTTQRRSDLLADYYRRACADGLTGQ